MAARPPGARQLPMPGVNAADDQALIDAHVLAIDAELAALQGGDLNTLDIGLLSVVDLVANATQKTPFSFWGSPFSDPKGKEKETVSLLSGAMLFRDTVLQPGLCLAGGSGANKAKWSEGYSPDLNPIEQVFAKLKAHLRAVAPTPPRWS